jgi:hypothetical protein
MSRISRDIAGICSAVPAGFIRFEIILRISTADNLCVLLIKLGPLREHFILKQLVTYAMSCCTLPSGENK